MVKTKHENIPANLRNFCVSGGRAAVCADTDMTESSLLMVDGCACPPAEASVLESAPAGEAGAAMSTFRWDN